MDLTPLSVSSSGRRNYMNYMRECGTEKFFVHKVINYTSKYNAKDSYAYSPENVVGEISKYPEYGDFCETYMLRSYGRWWNESEAAQTDYMSQDKDPCGAEDYITLGFKYAAVPKQIHIYETYNPGAIVRIWGRYAGNAWHILWEGLPIEWSPVARVFIPPIRQIFSLVNEIRLEFNQSHLRYHTSIDAVMLEGFSVKSDFQIRMLNMFMFNTNLNKNTKRRTFRKSDRDIFSTLPLEIISHIFKYLDLKSLCRSAQVSKQWYEATLDVVLYRELSLKKYWHKVNNDLLTNFFTGRCVGMKKFDFSWCGNDGTITEKVFIKFLKACCRQLTHISLGYCDFVDNAVVQEIALCNDLVDLRLRNVQCDSWKFSVLSNLKKLVSLDLYSSTIIDEALIKVLMANPGLKHLIIDFCENLEKLDQVAETVSEYNKNLRVWSSWKTHSITSDGVKYLGRCGELRELDLGWCLILTDPGDCLEKVANGCKHLKRLIISGWRGISDHLLYPVVKLCHELTELDLLGNQNLTADICEMAFLFLPHLKLLELSFCSAIKRDQVLNWMAAYPHITIQRSCEGL